MSIVAGEGWKIYTGDAAVVPASLDGLFDGVFCDAPYGLSFMGKKWDVSVPSVELWSAWQCAHESTGEAREVDGAIRCEICQAIVLLRPAPPTEPRKK